MKRQIRGKTISKGMLIAGAMAAIMAVGGASAYFTATDNKTNTWTVGKVDVQLEEPLYDESADERDNITPNSDLTKDPQIRNTGNNDAFVFLKFSIPKANVKIASQDGRSVTTGDSELFTYTIDSSWVLIDKQEGSKENTYVYAYGTAQKCKALSAGETTPVLFSDGTIKFVNIVEGQGLDGQTLEIPVEAFAIQTADITEADTDAPSEVWAVLSGQADAVQHTSD